MEYEDWLILADYEEKLDRDVIEMKWEHELEKFFWIRKMVDELRKEKILNTVLERLWEQEDYNSEPSLSEEIDN